MLRHGAGIGYRGDEIDTLPFAVRGDDAVMLPRPVDDHAEGKAQGAGHVHGEGEVVKAEGVGSVTSTRKSLSLTASITGQDVPGGESMTRTSASRCMAFTSLMRGGDIASPGVRRAPGVADLSRRAALNDTDPPSFSEIAPGGQTGAQPPQEWHISGNRRGRPLTRTMALNSQIFPPPSHFPSSTEARR